MTSITTCLDDSFVTLFGLTYDDKVVSNTTYNCFDFISCLNKLCEVSNVHDVDMTCFMRAPINGQEITRIIYTQQEYNIRFAALIFFILLFYINNCTNMLLYFKKYC